MKSEKEINKSEVAPDINDNTEELEHEVIYEELHWSEVLQAVLAAFSCIEDIDPELASPMDKKRIKRIKRKGLRLVDVGISEIYAEKFDTDDNDEE